MLWMGGVKQAAYLPGDDGDRRGVIPVFYFCGVRLYCLCSQQCGYLAWGNLARETCIHNRLPRSVSVVPICPMVAGVHPLLGSVP
jgi:hypothetical protein